MKKKTQPARNKKFESYLLKMPPEDKEIFFSRSHDPIIAIEAFLCEYRAKRPIPEWVIHWLADGFQKYFDSNLQGSLTLLLGITDLHPQKVCIKWRNLHLFQSIYFLHLLGVDINTAIAEVLQNHEIEMVQLSGQHADILTVAYVRKTYYALLRREKKNPSFGSLLETLRKIASRFNNNQIKEHLMRYPNLKSAYASYLK